MSVRWPACALVLFWLPAAAAAAQPAAPELRYETLAGDPAAEPRLEQVRPDELQAIVRLVGLDDPGPPIRVVLAPGDSELARSAPAWVAGFAHGASDTVVLFPSRSVRYPHDSLAAVLRHEVAHILIGRAAGGRPVPRWFNEGLATVAERAWHFEDRWLLAWALLSGDQARMDHVDALFQQGAGDGRRAYALSGAFVRHVMDAHGTDAPARILAALARGAAFDPAFAATTGRSLAAAERTFHADLTSWKRWVSLTTSPFVLWSVVTVLALYAIQVRRRRSAEQRRKWDEEDAREQERAALAAGDGDADGEGEEEPERPH